MSMRSPIKSLSTAILFAVISICGCETLHNAGVPGLDIYLKPDPVALENERRNREEFLVKRDHKALYWLLANKISNGMMLRDVEGVLGMEGEPTTDFNVTNTEGIHQTTDKAYKWGPDNSGCSVVIFFRDGHVSNFNPKDYQKL